MLKRLAVTVAAVGVLGFAASPAVALTSGGTGSDVIRGTASADVIHGNAGDDYIRGNDGDDVIYGGRGTDVIRGGRGQDTCFVDEYDTVNGCELVVVTSR